MSGAPRRVALLGSTGSVGTQAEQVIAAAPDRFRVTALAASGGQLAALAAQAVRTGVAVVALSDPAAAAAFPAAFRDAARTAGRSGPEPVVHAGPDAVADVAAQAEADVVLNALPGAAGLGPSLAALRAGRTLALANKESLVAGGALVRAARRWPEQIVPVDSEHSALAQCLRGGRVAEVARLVLTASGGPFRGWSAARLAGVTPAQALAHPTWVMGPLVTVNSATLVNKGLETIEAHELFGLPYDRLGVVVHPTSVVHALVEFVDGSTLAQLSPPDMRLPIAVALGWPDRVPDAVPPLDLSRPVTLEFAPLDEEAFPAVALARAAGRAGGAAPCVYNAANEELVAAFLAERLPFLGIVAGIQETLAAADGTQGADLGAVMETDAWARRYARAWADRVAKETG